ncbi:TIGR04282 family arsenosugar biosynthesis glycosyltransferase [Thiocapsa bogorovii]|uniref:TIGR04282 family arsenosugar biosynthesis glycosyltransferase n=1 Tax=Thiocapsa bogorovii TaxID=521689 RepID=UPI001E35DD8D|nr:TIGR04282 family arsenosugar biosynthesis glycosyltransferase [Thiocapsa bogorovii]UHD17317.1 TIGR04282 family arsenosugar biosynthesis glycosyltransferase [Thiocapsa bogorovii]
MRYPNARILIFAKAPIPGQVKTRLIPALGPTGAAELACDLLERLVRRLSGAHLAPVELWCSPDSEHPLFRALAASAGVALRTQQGEDLGERLSTAAEDALGRADAVLLLGADIPSLDADYCASALATLGESDAALGPAEDGGYVLLGLKAPAPALFTDMPWGGEHVAAMTRGRIASLGWRCSELPVLWDLDRPEDLMRYRCLKADRGDARPKARNVNV